MPDVWLAAEYTDESKRRQYADQYDLGHVPPTMGEFGTFYTARRDRMVAKLRTLLGVAESPPVTGSGTAGNTGSDPTSVKLLANLNKYLGTTWQEKDVPALPPDPGWTAAQHVLEAWAARSNTTLRQWSKKARRVLEQWWAARQRGGG